MTDFTTHFYLSLNIIQKLTYEYAVWPYACAPIGKYHIIELIRNQASWNVMNQIQHKVKMCVR